MPVDDMYAPPVFDVDEPVDVDALAFTVSDGLIHGYNPMTLPADTCVRCGSHEPGGKTRDKKLYYVPKWTLFLILLNVLIAMIAQLIARKRIDVTYYVCPECWRTRKQRLWVSGGAILAGLGLIFGGAVATSGLLAAVGGIVLVGAILAMGWFARGALRASSHSNGLFTLKGASAGFLSQVRADQRDPRDQPNYADPAAEGNSMGGLDAPASAGAPLGTDGTAEPADATDVDGPAW